MNREMLHEWAVGRDCEYNSEIPSILKQPIPYWRIHVSAIPIIQWHRRCWTRLFNEAFARENLKKKYLCICSAHKRRARSSGEDLIQCPYAFNMVLWTYTEDRLIPEPKTPARSLTVYPKTRTMHLQLIQCILLEIIKQMEIFRIHTRPSLSRLLQQWNSWECTIEFRIPLQDKYTEALNRHQGKKWNYFFF